MYIYRSLQFTWEAEAPEGPTDPTEAAEHAEVIEPSEHTELAEWITESSESPAPTTPSTAFFVPFKEGHRQPTAAAYNPDDDVEYESLQKLKDWIDYPPPFKQKDKTSPVFLFKPEFTFAILMEGLIYVVGKHKALLSEFRTLITIVVMQYKQDVNGWSAKYGLGAELRNVCLDKEINSEDWENELRDAVLTGEEKRLLRRTIVAVARIVEKMEDSNYDMKVGIGMLQGDLEPDDEEEEVQDEGSEGSDDVYYEGTAGGGWRKVRRGG